MNAPFINLHCETQRNKDVNILLAVIDTILLQEKELLEAIESLKTEIEKIAEEPIRNFIKEQLNSTVTQRMLIKYRKKYSHILKYILNELLELIEILNEKTDNTVLSHIKIALDKGGRNLHNLSSLRASCDGKNITP